RPESARAAGWIVRNAERMGRMIDQLLDLTRSRLGSGISLTTEDTSLREAWQRVIDGVRRERAARVSFSCAQDVCGSWYADRLAQVCANLLGNALDHGSADAPVSV